MRAEKDEARRPMYPGPSLTRYPVREVMKSSQTAPPYEVPGMVAAVQFAPPSLVW